MARETEKTWTDGETEWRAKKGRDSFHQAEKRLSNLLVGSFLQLR